MLCPRWGVRTATAAAAAVQVYGRRNAESPRCMQQLLQLSQGAAETLQEAVLQLLGRPEETATAAAKPAAAAATSVDARDVDPAEASPVSSGDERPPAASAAAARSSSKRKMVA